MDIKQRDDNNKRNISSSFGVMENLIVISPRVLGRMKNMSDDDRRLILDTFVSDEVLHLPRRQELSPIQELIYMMFRDAVMRESFRHQPVGSCAMIS
ncbi:MAG: hypothetical protein II609_04405 [Muribaculaceae bacterium]|nr:hypothetical protein [Muribaculaceae bacterium]